MPSSDVHVEAARKNQATLAYLLIEQNSDYLPWIVSVAFYKGLHIVEAMLELDTQAPVPHTDNHASRNMLLKSNRRYSHIWKMYRELYQASLIARYLQDDNGATYDSFEKHMPRKAVESRLIGHCLRQIQVSAASLTNDVRLETV